MCSCPAGEHDRHCKHLAAVAMYREAQDQLEQARSLESKVDELYR